MLKRSHRYETMHFMHCLMVLPFWC
uniref:Uncharacterized protein n=1 Tax=Anguilla anguilla TaxID=7936 RepID=A0A0E9T5I4_ANGAN